MAAAAAAAVAVAGVCVCVCECVCSLARSLCVAEIPTETWMFAPLVDYHGGGAPAALEPFADNIDAWEWTLATHLGAGAFIS